MVKTIHYSLIDLDEDRRGEVERLLDTATGSLSHHNSFSDFISRERLPSEVQNVIFYLLPEEKNSDFLEDMKDMISDDILILLLQKHQSCMGRRALKLGASDYLILEDLNADMLEKAVFLAMEKHQLRQRIEDSEEKFQALIHNNFDAFLIQGEDSTIISASKSIENLSGYKLEEVIGLKGTAFVHEDDVEQVLTLFKKVVNGEQRQVQFKQRVQIKDATYIWIEAIVTDCRHIAGINSLVTNLRNIDKEKRVLQDLKVQKERLQKVLRLSKMGYWWFNLQSFELIWSQEVYDLYGLEPESFDLNFGNYLELVHPDDRHLFSPQNFKALEGREQDAIEYRVLHSDDRYIWLRGTARLVSTPNGTAGVVEGAVQDITERKLGQIKVEERENRLRLFMENSPALSWLKDADGRLLAANDRYMKATGRIQDDIGKKTEESSTGEIAPETRETDIEVLKLRKPMQVKEIVPNAEGDLRTYEVYKFPIESSGKLLLGGFALDVTDKLKYLDAIEKQNERLREIAWIQSHVVRAPLARMLGLVELMNSGAVLPDESDKVLRELNNSAGELDEIICSMIKSSSEIKAVSNE